MTNIVYKYPHSNDNSQYASDCQTGGGVVRAGGAFRSTILNDLQPSQI